MQYYWSPKELAALWEGVEWKKWIVYFWTGSEKKPSYKREIFVCARTIDEAEAMARRRIYTKPKGRLRARTRLANPRELECSPVSVTRGG